ncbi:OBERON-like protein [Coffea eugenioides]|uniref:OBERON-like protein n=1 Tax=Coffea eugenioides TaxID=49369 RepID=UPI000F60C9A5|nr:OBERON-like protein [Coffea eugenioides]XP_027165334.1 OBERON-like protein [Coffea eugenioides]
MEIDSPDASSGSISGTREENGFHLNRVSVGDYGEGLPYAPIDWPKPGDNWSWRVGKRIASSGHFLDRYLYPPKHLQDPHRKKVGLASKQSVEQFIRAKFPDADVNAFFASFSWKIPSKQLRLFGMTDDKEENPPSVEAEETSASDSPMADLTCKAGNKTCTSLGAVGSASGVMLCDICCSEPGFCRDCCCILCCKTVSSSYGGYSYIRCQALLNGSACGHVAHLNCGLRAYMAGTVGGTIGLDAEYYCRRCDSRSDLVSHVRKLLKTCESINSRDDIEMILSVGISILRDSQRASAKQLLDQISLAMSKLRKGADLEDVWKKEEIVEVTEENGALELENHEDPPANRFLQPLLSSKFDHRVETLVLEDEIDQILMALKKSQESEYRLAEEALSVQKNCIQDLYQQLDHERSTLSQRAPSPDADAVLDSFLSKVDHLKQEITKFKDMKEVAKGFGRTPKHILKDHFNLETEN